MVNNPNETNKEYKTSGKTDEEIKNLTIEEDLSPIKKALFILSKGQSSQKAYVFYHKKHQKSPVLSIDLPKYRHFLSGYRVYFSGFLDTSRKKLGFFNVLFVKKEDLLTQNEDIQIEAGSNFLQILSENVSKSPDIHYF